MPVRLTAVARDTEHLDKLAGLPSPLRSCLIADAEQVVISDRHGYEGAWPRSVKALRNPSPEQVACARRALAAYEELCRPLADEDLAVELTKLRQATKASREEAVEWAVALDTFMDELGQHPADITVWAIRFWRRTEKFYPTPSELHLLIERREGGRKAIMDGLRRIIAADPGEAP